MLGDHLLDHLDNLSSPGHGGLDFMDKIGGLSTDQTQVDQWTSFADGCLVLTCHCQSGDPR